MYTNIPHPIEVQLNAIKELVCELKPIEPTNKYQKFVRAVLTFFTNLLTALIFGVLLLLICKLLLQFFYPDLRTENAVDILSRVPIAGLAILFAFFWSLRVLLLISKLIRSYRVLTILGLTSVITSLLDNIEALFEAESLAGHGRYNLGGFKTGN